MSVLIEPQFHSFGEKKVASLKMHERCSPTGIASRSRLLIKIIFAINYSFTLKVKTFRCENLIVECGN